MTGSNAVLCTTGASDLEPTDEFASRRARFKAGCGEVLLFASSAGGVSSRFVPRGFGDNVIFGKLEDEARGTLIRSN